MLRKFLLSLVLIAVVGFASAQSLNFEWQGTTYANGDRLICNTFEWGELMQHLQIRNNTNDALDIVIEKEEVQIVEGTMNYFCWGKCYGSQTVISEPFALAGNTVSLESELSFHQMIDPDGTGNPIAGTSVVRYYAYDAHNHDEKIMIEVWFAYEAEEVVDHASTSVFGKAYPNPASTLVNFDYSIAPSANASVSVYNLLGQEVLTQPVSSTQSVMSLSVSDLQEGVYFCNLTIDGQVVKTNKFVVKK